MFNELLQLNSQFIPLLGNFKVRSPSWLSNDILRSESSCIDFLTTTQCLHEIILKSTLYLAIHHFALTQFSQINQNLYMIVILALSYILIVAMSSHIVSLVSYLTTQHLTNISSGISNNLLVTWRRSHLESSAL